MSEASNVQASIAHLVLAGTSVWSLTAAPRQEFSYFGTFGNLLFHGGIGFFHFQNPKAPTGAAACGASAKGSSIVDACCELIDSDLSGLYCTSCQACRLLALPCAVTHMYLREGYTRGIAAMHVTSGLVPFFMYMTGRNHQHIGHAIVVANIMSVFYLSMEKKKDWGFLLTAASIFSFLFLRPSSGGLMSADLRAMYCASCQASRLIALPCTVAHIYIKAGYRKDVAYFHCLSGAIPFIMYLLGRNHEPIGNLIVIGNVMSLFYLSLDTKNAWGFVLTGASIFSFLFTNASTVSFEMTFNTLYPFSLCFYQYCALRAFGVN